jgi:hypothetical protein
MKIKSITEKIDLCREEDGLRLISEKKVLVEGFTDVGIVSNGLIPIIYFKDKKFAYLDEETFEIYEINNVDWISGLHYVGNNLSYLGHNYRTDPIKYLTDTYQFKTIEKVKDVLERFEGCEINIKPEKKFDMDLQKMVETGKVTVQCKFTPELTEKLFKEIKYYRIIGKGVLGKSINMGSKPIKLEDGSNYNSRLFSLSQKNELYGVIDVRTNKLVLETKYKKIDIYPEVIIVDSDEIINY